MHTCNNIENNSNNKNSFSYSSFFAYNIQLAFLKGTDRWVDIMQKQCGRTVFQVEL